MDAGVAARCNLFVHHLGLNLAGCFGIPNHWFFLLSRCRWLNRLFLHRCVLLGRWLLLNRRGRGCVESSSICHDLLELTKVESRVRNAKHLRIVRNQKRAIDADFLTSFRRYDIPLLIALRDIAPAAPFTGGFKLLGIPDFWPLRSGSDLSTGVIQDLLRSRKHATDLHELQPLGNFLCNELDLACTTEEDILNLQFAGAVVAYAINRD